MEVIWWGAGCDPARTTRSKQAARALLSTRAVRHMWSGNKSGRVGGLT
jgi:hypothetical protein